MNTNPKTFIHLALTVAVLFGLVTLGPAPLSGQKLGLTPHTNLQPQDEQTLQSEQKQTTVMGQVGQVDMGHSDQPVAQQEGAAQGANVVANAPVVQDPNSAQGKAVVVAAGDRVEAPKGNSWLLTAILVIAVVGAAIFGVKRWADNNIPAPMGPSAPKPRDW